MVMHYDNEAAENFGWIGRKLMCESSHYLSDVYNWLLTLIRADHMFLIPLYSWGEMAQSAKCLPHKCEALSSTFRIRTSWVRPKAWAFSHSMLSFIKPQLQREVTSFCSALTFHDPKTQAFLPLSLGDAGLYTKSDDFWTAWGPRLWLYRCSVCLH